MGRDAVTSAGRIVRGAFGVLRAQPVAVAVWTLVYIAIIVALAFAVRSGLPLQPETGASGDPGIMATAMGTNLLLNLVNLAIYFTLVTAAMRSVLRPSQPGIAFLRFGADELRQIALGLFLLILFYVGLILAGIVLTVITAVVVAAAGTGTAMFVAIGVDIAVLVIITCWLSLRFSLCFPLTLLRGTITISESWRLTRGRFWTLFGGFLPLYLLVFLVSIGIASVTMGAYFAEVARGGFTVQSLQAAGRSQMARQLRPIDMAMILGWIAGGIGAAFGVALQGGALATAARDLIDVRGEMADTFA
jgi:hypothetical protein